MTKIALITGSAGFIGTNLVKKLLSEKFKVVAVDNFSAAEKWKADLFKKNDSYDFIELDITAPDFVHKINSSKFLKEGGKIEEIYNLACPASPPRYANLALETIAASTTGLIQVLELARAHGAKVLHTSTSEVYGDPLVHPQTEDYRGNVNTVGPRSCYDEAKRISETICYEYQRLHAVEIKLVRIFNTYGPYMDVQDGRVITNFINQALNNEDITIYGQGEQTRSFQFITDLLDGFEKAMQTGTDFFGPVNLGNPGEFTIKQLAEKVLTMIPTKSKIVYKPLPQDDPKVRKPDITKAREMLGWEPKVNLEEGLAATIEYYRNRL